MKDSLEARIGRYLSGEMSDSEKGNFEQDLTTDNELSAKYQVYQRIWEQSHERLAQDWDVEAAFKKFSPSSVVIMNPKRGISRKIMYWSIAATIIFILGTYIMFFSYKAPQVFEFAEGSTDPILLADGSKIFLNKASSVTVYPFKGKKRRVELHGEAFFEVAADMNRPFTVISGGTVTEVVGTSFNIHESTNETSIMVSSGKVIFSSKDDSGQAVALTEGEAATFKANRMQLIANPSPNINSWRTHQLRFGKMLLGDIISDVSDYFGKEVIIESDANKTCPVSISLPFKKPEIMSVLNIVAASINATVVREGDKYILRGGECS